MKISLHYGVWEWELTKVKGRHYSYKHGSVKVKELDRGDTKVHGLSLKKTRKEYRYLGSK